ncbi:MAG: hypothetical protein RL358_32 [Pseudomonadota bacterium]|jgi:hypothetical protein
MSGVAFMRNGFIGFAVWALLGLFLTFVMASVALAAAESVPPITTESGHTVRLPFKTLGLNLPVRLVGADTQSTVGFSFHTVDVVERLRLHLRFSYSPTLNVDSSFLKLALNGNEIAALKLPHSDASNAQVVLEIDPIYLQEWNHLSFQFASHQVKPLCDDPRSQNNWIQLSVTDSYFEADTKRLPLNNDLALLPLPFFDKHDVRDLTLPIVFAAHPSWSALTAAGVMTSWFGSLADYRKIHFPSYLNSLPEGSGIVFVTSKDQIEGISLPEVTEGVATVSIINNPRNLDAKLLLVVGRDESGLIQAAQALAIGSVNLSGQQQSIFAEGFARRAPFDAPGWLQIGKKVRLGNIALPETLNSRALFLTDHELVLRLPPNVYHSAAAFIPFDFVFESSNNSRYLVRLDAYFNGVPFQFKTFSVPEKSAAAMIKMHVPLHIPTKDITGVDTISIRFVFAEKEQVLCNEKIVKDEIRVDPDSKIDLSNLSQYVELPNLTYLAYTGYPFSKLADLSESVVLLPNAPDRYEIESLLTTLGHIGNKTQYPAVAISVASVNDIGRFANKDILVIGATERLRTLFREFKSAVPINLFSEYQPMPYFGSRYVARWLSWFDEVARLNRVKGQEGMVVTGFESPLKSKRSVVVLTALHPDHLPDVASALNTLRYAKDFAGDIVVIGEKDIDGRAVAFNQAPKFAIGNLPLRDWLRNFVNNNSLLAVLLCILVALFFGSIMHLKMRQAAQARLGRGE